MTTERFRNALKARPFRPFVLRTADGEKYRVDHPELAMQTQGGQTICVNIKGEEVAILDVGLVSAIEFQAEAKPTA